MPLIAIDCHRPSLIASFLSAELCRRHEKMNAMTLDELRALAEGTSIRKPGEAWASCCPPDGSQAAIIATLKSYGDREAKGLNTNRSPHSLVAVPMYATDDH